MQRIEINSYDNFKILIRYYLLQMIPPFLYPYVIEFCYYNKFKKKINLKNPKTFIEKINWLRIYDLSPLKTVLTNKLKAKAVLKKEFPDIKYAKVLQIHKSFNDIDFSKCPKSFVIKTNHACKTSIYVADKTKLTRNDLERYSKYYKKILKIKYAYWGILELQYNNIEPHIYIEEFLQSNNSNYNIREYEVYCLNGEPEYIIYNCKYENNKQIYIGLDKDFHLSKFDFFHYSLYKNTNGEINVPNKEKIIEYSKKLSSPFKFVRVDFFEIDDILYFGEMTFSPHTGLIEIKPPEYDKILGDKLLI